MIKLGWIILYNDKKEFKLRVEIYIIPAGQQLSLHFEKQS